MAVMVKNYLTVLHEDQLKFVVLTQWWSFSPQSFHWSCPWPLNNHKLWKPRHQAGWVMADIGWWQYLLLAMDPYQKSLKHWVDKHLNANLFSALLECSPVAQGELTPGTALSTRVDHGCWQGLPVGCMLPYPTLQTLVAAATNVA